MSHEAVTTYKTRNYMDISLPKVRLEIAKRSFYYTGTSACNSLPHDVKAIKTLNGWTSRMD
jgi:hypothetical protein